MLLERCELVIKEGSEDGFAAAMKDRGIGLLADFPGVRSVNLGRGVENPHKFMLLVEWESMDAHGAYNKSPISAVFREMVTPFSAGGSMEHFNMG